jgi:hypothetical protein
VHALNGLGDPADDPAEPPLGPFRSVRAALEAMTRRRPRRERAVFVGGMLRRRKFDDG